MTRAEGAGMIGALESIGDARNSLNAREVFCACEGRPLFLCDWSSAVFIHYSIVPALLQPYVPYELDLREGKAWVSLVAFTIDRLRPSFGGRLAAFALQPIARHYFLNLRTYVRCGAECGIYFIKEWLSNNLSVLLGPRTFGLPYNFARMNYCNEADTGVVAGTVSAGNARFAYGGTYGVDSPRACAPATRDEFLLERYIAFTQRGRRFQFFRVWHAPWPQHAAQVRVADSSLLIQACPWFAHATYTNANFSPGVEDVWIGWPREVGRDL